MITKIHYGLPTQPTRLVLDRAIAYRPINGGELWLVGGYDSGTFLSVQGLWRWRLREPDRGWQEVHPIGALPSARSGQGWAYDSVRDQFIMHGGLDDLGAFLGDTWAFNPTTLRWADQQATVSPGSWAAEFAYDPVRDRFVRFGGAFGFGDAGRSDVTAEFNPASKTWAVIAVTAKPPKLQWGGMDYDPDRGSMIVFGGNSTGAVELNEVWIYDPATPTWREQMIPDALRPAARRGFVFGFHPVLRGLVASHGSSAGGNFDDSWLLTADGWRRLFPTGSPPPLMDYIYGVGVPGLGGIVAFGGQDQSAPPYPVFEQAWLLGRDAWSIPEIGLTYDADEIEVVAGARLRDPAAVADSPIANARMIWLSSLADIAEVSTIPGSDQILSALEFDDLTPQWWDGAKWSDSDLSAAEMSTLADAIANLDQLASDVSGLSQLGQAGFAIGLRIHRRLISATGATTPELEVMRIDHGFAAVPEVRPRTCRIVGVALGPDGTPAAGATVSVLGPSAGFFHGEIYIPERVGSAPTDANGHVDLEIFETTSINQPVTLKIDLGGGAERSASILIPDQPEADIRDLL